MIETLVIAAAIATWLGLSKDRVAAPARAAAAAGARAGAHGASQRRAASAPARSARATARRARVNGWTLPISGPGPDGSRVTLPFGRWLNQFADAVQGTIRGTYRAARTGGRSLVPVAQDFGSAAAAGWREARDEHRRRRNGEQPAQPGQPGQTGTAPGQPGATVPGPRPQQPASQAPGSDAPGSQGAAPQDSSPGSTGRGGSTTPTAPDGAPSQEGSSMTSTTVSVASLDVPDITALERIAREFAAAAELAIQLQPIAATAVGLPDALTFGPGKEVLGVVMQLAELAPDPQRLAAFAETLPLLLRAVNAQAGRNEHMAGDQLAGDVDQHVLT